MIYTSKINELIMFCFSKKKSISNFITMYFSNLLLQYSNYHKNHLADYNLFDELHNQ